MTLRVDASAVGPVKPLGQVASEAASANGADPPALEAQARDGVLVAVRPLVRPDDSAADLGGAPLGRPLQAHDPAKPGECKKVIAVDIDDTVLRHHPRKPDYCSPESILENCRPIQAACDRVLVLIEAGFEVHFVTGRSKVVLKPTLAQLKTWISTSILAEHVHCNGVWAGYDALQEHKAERLRALGAVLMVGDHAADEGAAMDAGIPFLHADAFSAGAPLPLATPYPLLSVS